MLESQLRDREMVIQRFERETVSLRNDLKISRREVESMRQELAQQGRGIPQEQSAALARVEGLAFNSLLTSAQNHDQVPGDERFHAVFYPHDAQGEIVKIAGTIEFEAIDPSRSGDKTIGRWAYQPEETPELWHAGFLSSGYQVDMPWQASPEGSRVILLARLTTADGRRFETTKTIEVAAPPKTAEVPQELPRPKVASEIQAVKFEKTAENRPVPDPEPWEFKGPGGKPSKRQAPAAGELSVPAVPVKPTRLEASPSSARPFPGVQTSDSWTDATIPALR